MKPTKESKIKKMKGKETRRAWQTFQSNGNLSDEPITFLYIVSLPMVGKSSVTQYHVCVEKK